MQTNRPCYESNRRSGASRETPSRLAPLLQKQTRFKSLFAALLITASLLNPALAGEGVFRTVDAQGNVSYTDHPAPGSKRLTQELPSPDPENFAGLHVERNGDASDVYASNELGGPVQIELTFAEENNVSAIPNLPLRQIVPAGKRVLVSRIEIGALQSQASFQLSMNAMPGDPHASPDGSTYSLPVDEDSGWHIGQAFLGGFSHNDEQNRFAVDLIVPEGTPVLAARDGIVMQTETGFASAGLDKKKFATRANYVRVVHNDGTMAVYAHLKENGVMVRIGQHVSLGQLLGYSGNTGYSSGPHLHFCLQVNRGMALASVPFRMVGPRGFLPLPRR